MTVTKITDDTPRTEIAEALTRQAEHARRQQCVIGTEDLPSAWDRAHRRIDALLRDYFAARDA